MLMPPKSRPLVMTIHMPALPDDAVVEIRNFLSEILHLFEDHYGNQIHRFYQDRSFDNIVEYNPRITLDAPPF